MQWIGFSCVSGDHLSSKVLVTTRIKLSKTTTAAARVMVCCVAGAMWIGRWDGGLRLDCERIWVIAYGTCNAS